MATFDPFVKVEAPDVARRKGFVGIVLLRLRDALGNEWTQNIPAVCVEAGELIFPSGILARTLTHLESAGAFNHALRGKTMSWARFKITEYELLVKLNEEHGVGPLNGLGLWGIREKGLTHVLSFLKAKPFHIESEESSSSESDSDSSEDLQPTLRLPRGGPAAGSTATAMGDEDTEEEEDEVDRPAPAAAAAAAPPPPAVTTRGYPTTSPSARGTGWAKRGSAKIVAAAPAPARAAAARRHAAAAVAAATTATAPPAAAPARASTASAADVSSAVQAADNDVMFTEMDVLRAEVDVLNRKLALAEARVKAAEARAFAAELHLRSALTEPRPRESSLPPQRKTKRSRQV